MSIIVTNAMNIPAERAEEVTAKFAKNSKELVGRDGFEGFELCRPSDPENTRWLVITHWRDEASYQAWRDSKQFDRSHPGLSTTADPGNEMKKSESSCSGGNITAVKAVSCPQANAEAGPTTGHSQTVAKNSVITHYQVMFSAPGC